MKVYRPNKKGTGSAGQFDLDLYKNRIICRVELCPQSGPMEDLGKAFNWKTDKIQFSVSSGEFGAFVAYIRGFAQKDIKLIHKFNDNISTLELKVPTTEEEKKYGNWLLRLHKGEKSITLPMSPAEIINLEQVMVAGMQAEALEALRVNSDRAKEKDSKKEEY